VSEGGLDITHQGPHIVCPKGVPTLCVRRGSGYYTLGTPHCVSEGGPDITHQGPHTVCPKGVRILYMTLRQEEFVALRDHTVHIVEILSPEAKQTSETLNLRACTKRLQRDVHPHISESS
jgi:hypothetical protein